MLQQVDFSEQIYFHFNQLHKPAFNSHCRGLCSEQIRWLDTELWYQKSYSIFSEFTCTVDRDGPRHKHGPQNTWNVTGMVEKCNSCKDLMQTWQLLMAHYTTLVLITTYETEVVLNWKTYIFLLALLWLPSACKKI